MSEMKTGRCKISGPCQLGRVVMPSRLTRLDAAANRAAGHADEAGADEPEAGGFRRRGRAFARCAGVGAAVERASVRAGGRERAGARADLDRAGRDVERLNVGLFGERGEIALERRVGREREGRVVADAQRATARGALGADLRSEEHTSELQSP